MTAAHRNAESLDAFTLLNTYRRDILTNQNSDQQQDDSDELE